MPEKCAKCWHFIEPNDANADWYLTHDEFTLAEYLHLDSGEKEHDHDATPSGDIRTLIEWKRAYPSLFRRYPDGQIGPNSALFSLGEVQAEAVRAATLAAIGVELMNAWNRDRKDPSEMAVMGHDTATGYEFCIERDGVVYTWTGTRDWDT